MCLLNNTYYKTTLAIVILSLQSVVASRVFSSVPVNPVNQAITCHWRSISVDLVPQDTSESCTDGALIVAD